MALQRPMRFGLSGLPMPLQQLMPRRAPVPLRAGTVSQLLQRGQRPRGGLGVATGVSPAPRGSEALPSQAPSFSQLLASLGLGGGTDRFDRLIPSTPGRAPEPALQRPLQPLLQAPRGIESREPSPDLGGGPEGAPGGVPGPPEAPGSAFGPVDSRFNPQTLGFRLGPQGGPVGLNLGPTGTLSPTGGALGGGLKTLLSLLGIPTSFNPITAGFPAAGAVLGPAGAGVGLFGLLNALVGTGMGMRGIPSNAQIMANFQDPNTLTPAMSEAIGQLGLSPFGRTLSQTEAALRGSLGGARGGPQFSAAPGGFTASLGTSPHGIGALGISLGDLNAIATGPPGQGLGIANPTTQQLQDIAQMTPQQLDQALANAAPAAAAPGPVGALPTGLEAVGTGEGVPGGAPPDAPSPTSVATSEGGGPGGGEGTSGGPGVGNGCCWYLTTAIQKALNLPDSVFKDFETLRQWHKTQRTPFLQDYIPRALRVIDAIEASPDKQRAYQNLYTKFVQPVHTMIRAKDYPRAARALQSGFPRIEQAAVGQPVFGPYTPQSPFAQELLKLGHTQGRE